MVGLLVVSERLRYLASSFPASSEGLEDEVDEDDWQLSLKMEPNLTGLGYLTEALGRHSTRGASGGAVMASPPPPRRTRHRSRTWRGS